MNATTRTSSRTLTRTLGAAALCVTAVVGLSASAQAGGSRVDHHETHASASWTDRGAVAGLLGGTVHRGVVFASDDLATAGTDVVTGRLEAWSCPAGAVVPQLYSHEDPDAEATACTYRGARDLVFGAARATFASPRRSATIEGRAVAVDPSGARADVAVQVSLQLQARGAARTDVQTTPVVAPDGTAQTLTTTLVDQRATVRGTVGPIGVGDEPSDTTSAALGSQDDVYTPAR